MWTKKKFKIFGNVGVLIYIYNTLVLYIISYPDFPLKNKIITLTILKRFKAIFLKKYTNT
jgi:hypothetical protein